MQKKIAVICNYELLEDRVGGMDYFFWAFDKACKHQGLTVDWFFPNKKEHGHYGLLNIIVQEGTILEESFIKYSLDSNTKYSHIFTHFIELCTSFFYKLKKVHQAKVIAVDHNPRPLYGYPFKKIIEKKIKGLIFSRYIDVFVGVSDYAKQALLHDFGCHVKKKVVVIFNGLDVSKYKHKTNFTAHNKFIVASHLRPEKGVQDLILAVKVLKAYNFTIDIYGKGHYQDKLQQMVKEYGLQNKISFKGSVSNLHEIYYTYDYLIHPSHGETFCYSVVESLLSQLPVITTRKQGNVLGLVQENTHGFLFEAKDVKTLSGLLTQVINEEKIIKAPISISKEDFSIQHMVANYLKLLNN